MSVSLQVVWGRDQPVWNNKLPRLGPIPSGLRTGLDKGVAKFWIDDKPFIGNSWIERTARGTYLHKCIDITV